MLLLAAPTAALDVGRVSELDLDEVRGIIDQARPPTPIAVTPPPGASARSLTLEEAIVVALEQNLRLQIVSLDRDVQEREVPATRARFHPTPGFDVFASSEREADPSGFDDDDDNEGTVKENLQEGLAFVRQELPSGGQIVLSADLIRATERDDDTNDEEYEGGTAVSLIQPLMRGGRTYVARREILDAEYDLGILEADVQSEILRVLAETKEAYHNTVLAQRLIEVSREAVERDRRLVEASAELFEAGRAQKRDVLSAQIQLSDDLAELANRRGDLQRSQLVLRDVLGMPIGEYVVAADNTIPFRPIEIRLGRWIETALRNRPEIHALLVRLEQSDLNIRNAENAVLPKLDLVGGYRRFDFSPTSRRAYGYDNYSWTAGLQFEIPFGNVAARERLAEARIQHKRIQRELANQRRLVEIEVRNEEITLRESVEELEAQTNKVQEAREKLEVAVARYRLGVANNLDVTDAQQDLVDAESDLLSAIVDYVNGLARLESRVAGPI
jgi:outer membrane protein TolC